MTFTYNTLTHWLTRLNKQFYEHSFARDREISLARQIEVYCVLLDFRRETFYGVDKIERHYVVNLHKDTERESHRRSKAP